jgi:serine/threonine protein kinase
MVPERALGDEEVRQACAELARRLRSGEDCRAEHFLQASPSLASNPHYALELICTEFATRRDLGQPLDPADWLARFPQWREQLEEKLQSAGPLRDSSHVDQATLEEQGDRSPPERLPAGGRRGLFARYEIHEELGRGSMGVVYKARDTVLGRLVALKMIRAGVLARPDEVERFYREARAAAQLNHPYMVGLHEIGQEGDQHFFTMTLAQKSLAQERAGYAGQPQKTAALVEKIARAVHHAHTRGILHRDLKPGNVLLDERGEPLVSDFGLAKFLDADAELTQTGVIIGTPAYMAPEQAAAEPGAVTAASDVWSLGVILYELLTELRPFVGKGLKEISERILKTEPPRPRSLRPRLAADLETITLKCLEKDPTCRYASAEALAEDLARWQRGEPIHARPESRHRRAWRFLRGHPALTAATVFLAAFTAMVLITQPRPESPDRPLPSSQPQSIALLGPKGLPSGSRVVLGQADTVREKDGVVRVQAKTQGPNTVALIDLGQAPPWKHYRLHTDVRHLSPSGAVGIYFLFHRQGPARAKEYWFCEFDFSEKTPGRDAGKVDVSWYLRRISSRDRIRDWRHPIASQTFARRSRPWRHLVIEVTPYMISAYWDGSDLPFSSVPWTTLQAYANQLAEAAPVNPSPPSLVAPGRFGLFCEKGTARFRQAILEPLPEQKWTRECEYSRPVVSAGDQAAPKNSVARTPMAVKVANTSPLNGDQNVPITSGAVTVQGTIDETATLNAFLAPGGGAGIPANENPTFINVPANQTRPWQFTFGAPGPAVTAGNNKLTVQGDNPNGTGSAIISIKLVRVGVPPFDGEGAGDATEARADGPGPNAARRRSARSRR